ncbi:hypothetical protein [Alicyclobacillus macrosporangiidus]|uniref:hypothetical protein n=1 Tax=Alicyclobacillus macrosporangiidus TaxID=392015 RepID=UPI00049688DE|nr:hypothetical protein [Alicyclobacillus macrosporangiidus]
MSVAVLQAPAAVKCFICHQQHPVDAMRRLATGEYVCDAPECRGTVVQCDRCEQWFYEDDIAFERSGIHLCRNCEPYKDSFDWWWIEQ